MWSAAGRAPGACGKGHGHLCVGKDVSHCLNFPVNAVIGEPHEGDGAVFCGPIGNLQTQERKRVSGRKGLHSFRHRKDKAGHDCRRQWGGRGSPKPLRSQEALLCWLWMGPSRHFCQRVLETQELKHHCTCLPWPSSPPSQCSRPIHPQHLGCHVILTPKLLFLDDSRVHHPLFQPLLLQTLPC